MYCKKYIKTIVFRMEGFENQNFIIDANKEISNQNKYLIVPSHLVTIDLYN